MLQPLPASARCYALVMSAILWLCADVSVAAAEAFDNPFNGTNLDGWMRDSGQTVPEGWEVVDGVIHRRQQKQRAGNILTRRAYGDFRLSFEWAVAKGGNSGIKYRVRKYGKKTLGLEYQMFDDASRTLSPRNSSASLYDLYEPNADKVLKPAGEFNTGMIVVQGDHIEHWLNGQLVVTATVGDDDWQQRVADSKFNDAEDFARNPVGQLMITDHGSEVWLRDVVFEPVLAQVAAVPPAQAEQPRKRPNVLFIAVDDLNDWVGCLGGHPQALTPNIDRLAKRGMNFTNAHAQAPLCGPSRASLLTGKYPHTIGMYEQPRKKGLEEDTALFRGHLLPECFAQHGYATFGVGKITHGYPMDIAFQEAGGTYGGAGPKPGDETVRFNYEPDWSVPYTGTQTDWGAFPDSDEEMPDHQVANWAIERLHQPHEKPFFLAVGFVRPHVPLYVPQKWFDLFPLDQIVLPEVPADDLDDVPAIARRIHEMPRYPSIDWLRANNDEQFRKCVQGYLACVAFVDHEVGRVLTALYESSYGNETVVVLFGDHGYHLGEKHRVCKHGLWEEATRVPLMVVRPGERAGKSCTRPVGLIDLFPTLTDLCRLPSASGMEGQSLVPLLDDPQAKWRDAILTTYARGNHTLRSERYRFIRYEDGSEELYDHQTDPMEWSNLANDPHHADVLRKFRATSPEQRPVPSRHECSSGERVVRRALSAGRHPQGEVIRNWSYVGMVRGGKGNATFSGWLLHSWEPSSMA